MLAEVLAGKDKVSDLAVLGVLRPGIRPEDALRDALGKVESRRRVLVASDERPALGLRPKARAIIRAFTRFGARHHRAAPRSGPLPEWRP